MLNTVSIQQGSLIGICEDGYTLYRGIPYAAPPTGPLRWKAPEPHEGWKGIYRATRWPSRCPHTDHQPGSFYHKEFFTDPFFMPDMNEDCLYLNVWTPAKSPDDRLPVAVYIHGGGFCTGSGCDYEFDGAALSQKGLIMVTVNYRLNAFGFLVHPWLSAESGRSGNYGIFDQIAALSWVRENIMAFGGDPDNITIFGQSAGAISVQTLVSSPLTCGWIRGAIIQSGGGYKTGLNVGRNITESEVLGKRFVDQTGAKNLDELRQIPAWNIVKYVEAFLAQLRAENIGLPFRPVVDGYLLTKDYEATVDNGEHHDIAYMIGLTANDIGPKPVNEDRGQLYQACVDWSLKNEALGRAPAYVYYFTREPLGDDAGAFHCAELWYMFGILDRSWRPKEARDYELQEECVCYWANFIKTGNPNNPDSSIWPPCENINKYVHEIK